MGKYALSNSRMFLSDQPLGHSLIAQLISEAYDSALNLNPRRVVSISCRIQGVLKSEAAHASSYLSTYFSLELVKRTPIYVITRGRHLHMEYNEGQKSTYGKVSENFNFRVQFFFYSNVVHHTLTNDRAFARFLTRV